jgi:selenophosphate synthase
MAGLPEQRALPVLRASVALPEQDDKLRVAVAAGIAVLQTSQTIMEVLEDDELVSARVADNAELLDQSEGGQPAD